MGLSYTHLVFTPAKVEGQRGFVISAGDTWPFQTESLSDVLEVLGFLMLGFVTPSSP